MAETFDRPTLLSDLEFQKLSAQEKETYVKEVLRKTLEKNPHGLTVSQLKEMLPFDRRVIEKHLGIMKFTNELYTVAIGSNILYIPNHKAMHEATSASKRLGNHEYQVYTLQNRLGDFVVIQQRDLNRDSQDITGGLNLPKHDFGEFVSYLRKAESDMESKGD